MISKIRFAAGLVLLLSLFTATPSFAGGWAVITLDELPANVVAGEPLTIGFTVRQHGRTPMTGLAPTITATLYKDEQFVVHATPEGEPGHYTATLTFPQEGEWSWSIQAFTMDQPMPVLTVAAAVAAKTDVPAPAARPAASLVSPLVIVRALALATGLAGLLLVYRRKARLALVLLVGAVFIGLASFLMGSTIPAVEAQTGNEAEARIDTSAVSQVELGRQLFLAKGCITCHRNSRADTGREYVTIMTEAPDLSNYSSSPQILEIRLKDPTAARADTQMPNLGLKKEEIDALIAFLNNAE
jgi:hypothetical protein